MEDLERPPLFEDLDAKKGLINCSGSRSCGRRTDFHRLGEQPVLAVGSALIVSPFEDAEQKIVGVLG